MRCVCPLESELHLAILKHNGGPALASAVAFLSVIPSAFAFLSVIPAGDLLLLFPITPLITTAPARRLCHRLRPHPGEARMPSHAAPTGSLFQQQSATHTNPWSVGTSVAINGGIVTLLLLIGLNTTRPLPTSAP